jgi:hypothetical protein
MISLFKWKTFLSDTVGGVTQYFNSATSSAYIQLLKMITGCQWLHFISVLIIRITI